MPNWCSNTLTISGSEQDLTRLRGELESSESVFDFEMILPTPRQLFEGQGWYNWRVSNWGTKWEADCPSLDLATSEQLVYHFATAWSPPAPLIEMLSLNFPGLCLLLEYNEPGNAFMGRLRVSAGRVEEDEYWEMTEQHYQEMYGE